MFPSKKQSFLQQTKEEREKREIERARNTAATSIQKWMRNTTGRIKVYKQLRCELDQLLNSAEKIAVPATDLFWAAQKLLFLRHSEISSDFERLNLLCKSLLVSMEANEVKMWYVSVSLNKNLAVRWIEQMKQLLVKVCHRLSGLKPNLPKDCKVVTLYLNVIVLFTDYTLWKFTEKAGDVMKPTLHKLCLSFIDYLTTNGYFTVMHELLLNGLCNPQPGLSRHSLPAAMCIRSLALSHFEPKLMVLFTRHILTVPAVILHLKKLSVESLQKLEHVKFLFHLVSVLSTNEAQQAIVTNISQHSALCLLANLIHLGSLQMNVITDGIKLNDYEEFLEILIPLCGSKKLASNSAATSWHPLLGWSTGTVDKRSMESLVHVRHQLQHLWYGTLVEHLFSPILALTPAPQVQPSAKGRGKFSLLSKRSGHSVSIDQHIIHDVCRSCHMYDRLLQALPQIATDVLVGLGCNHSFVMKFWCFLKEVLSLDPDQALQRLHSSRSHPLSSVLSMFCQVTEYLIAILDDEELFVQQQHFTVEDLVEMSSFLNRLVFKLIWEQTSSSTVQCVLEPCCSLLTLLHSRDSRRKFCDTDHWLIRDLKASTFLHELKTNKPRAAELLRKMPHSIPHRKRVEIFHQRVQEDRHRLGLSRSRSEPQSATYITCHRGRILEDGYTQLSLLSSDALKKAVKVKFINEQGLDEAGIDEMGVFKEFLEETIKLAFNPTLNLFKENTTGHIYPSPTSHVQENHLSLFEFVGKMLGKAVYEGIVVDVPLAPFFLSQMLEHHHSSLYSSLDELPSMDPQLYQSLSFIKHFDDDVADLCLTFSFDEDFMGKVITHELIPGGCGISVTNENRINYVHKMAHFRMRTQLKNQSNAFIRGFHSIIPKHWISCFVSHELQRLISGDQIELDVDDLRRHTQYYGGYHDKHRVIMWLWDIVKSFTSEEKGLFLKFVTSCSKPPLLGFAHLEPPFSIRFVDVSDEEDRGDSVASVIRGLFSVRRSGGGNRLPTASTCFNLLKLPNYSRKGLLKEKLRYSILSNAGFELS